MPRVLKLSRWLLAPTALLLAATPLAPMTVSAAPPDKVDGLVREQAAHSSSGLAVLITRRSTTGTLNTLNAHHALIRHQLKIGNSVAATVAPGDLDAIAADPDVVRIAYDAPMQVTSTGPDPLTLASNLLPVYPGAVQAAQAWNAPTPIRGTGVGIAVIDSGVASVHPDFMNANINGATATSRITVQQSQIAASSGGATDDNGHGTWVSGIAGGRGWSSSTSTTEGQYIGIAPDANLIELKVADVHGQSLESDVVNALQWVTDNHATYNIRVVNLSLVSSVAESYKTSNLDAAVEMAWLKGIVVVVAAGNNGPNTALYAPANDPYVISVGATDDMGTATTADDQLTSWSSYGTTQDGYAKPELVAPGRHIVGPLSGTSVTLATQFPNNIVGPKNLYISLSGTSAAAPVVTGLVADLLQARPYLKPDEVKAILMGTALPIPGLGTGAGYPQLLNAVNTTNINQANQDLVPNNYLAAAGCQSLPAGTNCAQANWSTVSWNTVSWNTVSWNTVSWNTVSWNTVSWNTVTPSNVAGS